MITENLYFYNNRGQRIAGRIYRDEEMSKKGVIFCHGLFSSKDGYKITMLSHDIVKAGYTLFTFDFSFVGQSEGHISELSILQEVEDLKSAFMFFKDYGLEEINLMGSSMGGVVSLLITMEKKFEIKTLTLIATPVNLHSIIPDNLDIEGIDKLPDKEMTSLNGIQINNRFFRELKQINTDIAINNLMIPTIIIHGLSDKVVAISNARHLSKNLKSQKKLVIINGGDHHLSRESDINVLRENIIDWWNKYS